MDRAHVEPRHGLRPRLAGIVNSMSDLFHEEIPDEYIAAVFGVMAAASWHTFQVLTKRPERMREWFEWHHEHVVARDLRWSEYRVCEDEAREYVEDLPASGFGAGWPLPNVWLGVTIENRRFVHRADLLRATPAAVRFISAEPLLGPLVYDCGKPGVWRGWRDGTSVHQASAIDLTRIDWLIAGAESGHGARPMDEQWVRDLRDECGHAGTAFFYRQRATTAGRKVPTPELDGRQWLEMPS